MRKQILILFCIFTGVLCACNQGKEINATVTPAEVSITPFPTPEVTLTGLPMPTAGLEEELIPIDAEHFTSAVFREYISRYYDSNKDGVLSQEERDTVTEIEILYYEKEFDKECLDGFEFFPNLVSLNVSTAEKVVLQNHPNVQNFGGDEGSIGIVRIENCPALSFIGFHSFGISSLYISKVSPKALFDLSNSCQLNHVEIDADISLHIEDPINGEVLFKGMENGTICYEYPEQTPIEFLHQNKVMLPFSEEYWQGRLEKNGPDFYQVQVLEKAEVVYNAEGEKGFEVCFELREYQRNPLLLSDQRWVLHSDTMKFDLYADTMPSAEQIVFCPAQIHEVRALEYSPNRGVSMLVTWDLNVIFRNKTEEKVLGVLEGQKHYCFLDAEGAVKVYPSWRAWEKWKNAENVPGAPNILIDEEHFSSQVFRRYIENNYNTDYYEGLTVEEQEAVKIMDFSGSVRFYGETLDGFEHFPCLSELYLGAVETLIVENHPSLKVIGGHSRGLKKVVIRNCPELERIDLDLSAVEEVVIEGCGKLK